ncbi:putative gustatory receptor 93c [Drosophila mojavensis]|nr:putative gustatory receptor 93c [Drosophila mojavensis]
MFGSRRCRFNASSVSANILRGSLKYAIFMGIICFSVKRNGNNGPLVAKNRKFYTWFCLISRILICGLYCILIYDFIYTISISQLRFIVASRFFICVVCAISTLMMQYSYGHIIVDVVNRFLRLLQRINALPGCQDIGYGDKWVLVLLLVKVIGLAYELCYLIPLLFFEYSSVLAVSVICDIYNTANVYIILHIYFVAYLSIGIAYDQVNNYIRYKLRRDLCEVNSRPGIPISQRKLKTVGHCLNECLAIYEEIHEVGKVFHELFDFLLCIIVLFGFLSLASIAFFVMLNLYNGIRLLILAIKILLDILLLTIAVHIASSNSRVIRLLSFENCCVSESKDWHMKLEMFLSRLNYKEFRPLGLFEVSNEMILVFMSGLVTYLTYIIQYDMKTNPT